MNNVEYRSAFRGWLAGAEPHGVGLVRAGVSDTSMGLMRQVLRDSRALGTVSPDLGGYLAPVGLEEMVFAALAARSAAWQHFSRMETPDGRPLSIVTADDRAAQATVYTEGQSRAEIGDLTVGQVVSRPSTFSTGLLRVSVELLTDADLAEPTLAALLADRLRRGLDRIAFTGTGPGQPTGLCHAATQIVEGGSGTATSVVWGDLQSMVSAIAAPYRHGPDGRPLAKWVMADASWRHIASQVDGSGSERAAAVVDPELGPVLLGHQVVVDDNLPTMAAGARSILFGDLERAALLRVCGGLSMLRLAELYATSYQVALLGELRADIVVTDRAALVAYQHSTA